MAVKFTNNAKTTLASGINSSVTTATVTDGSVFPTLAAGEHFYCTFDDGTNNEIVKVTARSGNTLTIIRGVDNTTARSFTSGDAAELRATSALLTDIQENIAAKSANQTVYNTTTASSATDYDIGIDPGVEANAMVFLNGVMQHHDTFSFSGSTLTFDTAPPDGMALEVIVDNLINLQSSNLTVDTFTAADVGGNPQTDFTLSDAPAAEDNLLVFIDGVFQDQDAYTISNQTLTITDGVTADFGVTVYVINPVNIGTPSDGTVTSSKLSGNITMPADLTVTGDVAFDSPTFVVDNANSRVGIGTASPSTLLDIVGDVNMSANLTVDTSTLVVDATNNHVGIGTSSPVTLKSSTTLQVNGNAKLGDDNGRGLLSLGDIASTGANVGIWRGSAGAYAGTGNFLNLGGYDGISFTTGNADISSQTERMRIDSSGNVKVNDGYLEVNTESTAAAVVRVDYNSTDSVRRIHALETGGGNARPLQIHAQDVRFRDDTAERLRIDSSGNVGIGFPSPQAKLQVLDQLKVSTSDQSQGVVALGDGSSTQFGVGIARWNGITNSGGAGGLGYFSQGSINAGGHFFYTGDAAAGSTTERMRIDSAGNVGIGTTSLATPLTVGDFGDTARAATFHGGSILVDGGAASEIIIGDGNVAYMSIQTTDNATAMKIRNFSGSSDLVTIERASGNVGIGTTSPSEKLHVAGKIRSEAQEVDYAARYSIASGTYTAGTFYDFTDRSTIQALGYGNGIYVFKVYDDTYGAGGGNYFVHYLTEPFYFHNTGSNSGGAFEFTMGSIPMGHAANGVPGGNQIRIRMLEQYGGSPHKFQWSPGSNNLTIDGTSGKTIEIDLFRYA